MTITRLVHLRSKLFKRRTVCGKDIRAVAWAYARSAATCEKCTVPDAERPSWETLRVDYSDMQSSTFWLIVIGALEKFPLTQTFTAADLKRAAGLGTGPYSLILFEAEKRGLIELVTYSWHGRQRFKHYRRVV